MTKLSFSTKIAGADIELYQTGDDSFTTRYGLQIKNGLSYSQAAADLGANIMHALTLDGKILSDEQDTDHNTTVVSGHGRNE